MAVTVEQVAAFNAKDCRVQILGSTLGDYWIVPDGDEPKILRREFVAEASEIPRFMENLGVAEKLAEFKRKLPSRIAGGKEMPKQFSLEDLD